MKSALFWGWSPVLRVGKKFLLPGLLSKPRQSHFLPCLGHCSHHNCQSPTVEPLESVGGCGQGPGAWGGGGGLVQLTASFQMCAFFWTKTRSERKVPGSPHKLVTRNSTRLVIFWFSFSQNDIKALFLQAWHQTTFKPLLEWVPNTLPNLNTPSFSPLFKN